jgi:toxin YoeB
MSKPQTFRPWNPEQTLLLPDPFDGIGKPEPLRENLAGCLSRRIDEVNRLVYRLDADLLVILACRYHYR